jgi:glycosyltransferase involved in cell wall biosynthesis
MDVRLEIMPGGSGPVAAWNHALKVSTGEWLVLGADDLVFNPGWYEEMARGFEQGGFVALTYYPNNTIIHDWATHFGMTREYIKKWNGGCMLTPHYHHQWIDPEASARAQYAGEYVEGVQIIEHKHPAYGTAEIDDTYRQGCYKWGTPDGEVFRRRQRQGFPDDFEAII